MRKYNVLITGNIDESAFRMLDILETGNCNVTVAGYNLKPDEKRYRSRYFELGGYSSSLSMVYKTGKFDTVIYVMSQKSEQVNNTPQTKALLGKFADEFEKNIDLIEAHTEISQLILITNQNVFANDQEKLEDVTPYPTTIDGCVMQIAENELNKINRKENTFKKLILRVPHVYSPGLIKNFARDFISYEGSKEERIYLNGTDEKMCNLLSCDDLAKLILFAITESSKGVLHCRAPYDTSYKELREYFEKYDYKVVNQTKDERKICLKSTRARKEFGLVTTGIYKKDLYLSVEESSTKKSLNVITLIREFFGKFLPWVETGIGAVLMQLLTNVTGDNAVIAFIDVRLLFAVIIGSAHGTFFGWLAGIIAYLSYAIGYCLNGGYVYNLLLNMDNWLPFVVYILAGGITGYIKTTHDDKEKELNEEKERVQHELDYLKDVHQYTCDMRDMLMEQVVKSRDSYGKIYSMISELDLVYPDEILFRTLRIFEDILSNNSVSIFTGQAGNRYIRKLVESENVGRVANSMNLAEYPELLEAAEHESLFVNKQFKENYPAYCLTVKYDETREFIIMLWNVTADQYSKYYENLLVILSRLACMSLAKAVDFYEGPTRFIDNQRFLKQEEFIHSWQVRRQMRLENVGTYIVLRFAPSLPDDVLAKRLEKAVRQLDIAGKMKDGTRYMLMVQAKDSDAEIITKRMESAGIAVYVTDESELSRYVEE